MLLQSKSSALEQNIISHVNCSKSALDKKKCSEANFMSNVVHPEQYPEQNQCSGVKCCSWYCSHCKAHWTFMSEL